MLEADVAGLVDWVAPSANHVLQRRATQTIPTPPSFKPTSGGGTTLIHTPIAQDSEHSIHAEAQLKGLKLFIIKVAEQTATARPMPRCRRSLCRSRGSGSSARCRRKAGKARAERR